MATQRVRPLIYQPPPRWYFWTAFGAALAIHLTAVAVSQRREAPPVDLLLNRRWSSRRYWRRLRPLHRQKIFRSPSLLLLQTSSRNSSKKEHRHRANHRRRRKNSCQSKPLGRCRCRERKPSPCTRPGPSTHTRRVRDTLRGVE